MNAFDEETKKWINENKNDLIEYLKIDLEKEEISDQDIKIFLSKKKEWYKENWQDNFGRGKFSTSIFLYNVECDIESVLY